MFRRNTQDSNPVFRFWRPTHYQLYLYPICSRSRIRTSTYRFRVCRACQLHQLGSSSGCRNRTCTDDRFKVCVATANGQPGSAERRGHDPQLFPTQQLSKPCCSLSSLLSICGSRRSRTPAGYPTPGFQNQCPTTRASASGVTRGTCILFFRSTI